MLGKVALVGAGPGDAGLLTLRAAELLNAADVVLYDRLVGSGVLERIGPQAERIYVGKEPRGARALPQAEIAALMVARARQGQLVVRLKGGDPFVFGRGGEEALALREAGIPYEIVPGVSAAIAVPAYAGIPVTHRGIARSFLVLPGHEGPALWSDSFRTAVTGVDTLVILMGVANLEELSAALMAAGRSGDEPAAAVSHGTLPEQRTVLGTVATLPKLCAAVQLAAPATVVVGEVARLHALLAWVPEALAAGEERTP